MPLTEKDQVHLCYLWPITFLFYFTLSGALTFFFRSIILIKVVVCCCAGGKSWGERAKVVGAAKLLLLVTSPVRLQSFYSFGVLGCPKVQSIDPLCRLLSIPVGKGLMLPFPVYGTRASWRDVTFWRQFNHNPLIHTLFFSETLSSL